jgi:biofilm protein TabA
MIIDELSNSDKYAALHPGLAKGFEYLKSQALTSLAVGKYPIDGDNVHASVSEKNGYTRDEAKFEAHNKYADIQLCLTDGETFGWKPRKDCQQPKGELNEEKDVIFYADEPDTYFTLKAGQFAIFYPEDVHAPMIGEGAIKKVVIKVKL